MAGFCMCLGNEVNMVYKGPYSCVLGSAVAGLKPRHPVKVSGQFEPIPATFSPLLTLTLLCAGKVLLC